LNGENYPSEDILNNFGLEEFETTLANASEFREKYYGLPEILNDFPITKQQFKTFYPLFVIDCRFQSEKIKESITDITIKVKFNDKIPADTKCYSLILSQKIVKMHLEDQKIIISSG
jgi:hypothetical protein